jgi:hypothetical protein
VQDEQEEAKSRRSLRSRRRSRRRRSRRRRSRRSRRSRSRSRRRSRGEMREEMVVGSAWMGCNLLAPSTGNFDKCFAAKNTKSAVTTWSSFSFDLMSINVSVVRVMNHLVFLVL